jgi:hypothetical protein
MGRYSVGYIDKGKYVAGHLVDWSAHAVGGKP